MASKTTVELLDDVDGRPAAETIVFGFDTREFEIDLSEKNAKALRKVLEPFAGSGRRVSVRTQLPARRGGNAAAAGGRPRLPVPRGRGPGHGGLRGGLLPGHRWLSHQAAPAPIRVETAVSRASRAAARAIV